MTGAVKTAGLVGGGGGGGALCGEATCAGVPTGRGSSGAGGGGISTGFEGAAKGACSISHEGLIRSERRSASSGEMPSFWGARFSLTCLTCWEYEYHAREYSAKSGSVRRAARRVPQVPNSEIRRSSK